jgi:hypothetical protein
MGWLLVAVALFGQRNTLVLILNTLAVSKEIRIVTNSCLLQHQCHPLQ